jgi:23S rRNA (adenine2030-N6)-methyltransferase
MLSYRHGFHAGNFADVVKHITLALVLEALKRKDAPFCVVDTHAGGGRYDLQSGQAQKNREYEGGIGRLWARSDWPAVLAPYRHAVASVNSAGAALRFYPGSPAITRALIRPRDRMVLCELHPTEIKVLQQEFEGDKQVQLEHSDGYTALKAVLPPRERRGVVLIDPAFERKDEVPRFVDAVLAAHRRWSSGIFCAWLPLLPEGFERGIYRALEQSGIDKILLFEFHIDRAPAERGMYGCALITINPPWQLDDTLRQVAPWLVKTMEIGGRGASRVKWLVPERAA